MIFRYRFQTSAYFKNEKINWCGKCFKNGKEGALIRKYKPCYINHIRFVSFIITLTMSISFRKYTLNGETGK